MEEKKEDIVLQIQSIKQGTKIKTKGEKNNG